jgi:hypothetical protein
MPRQVRASIESHLGALAIALALGSVAIQVALIFTINIFQLDDRLAYSLEILPCVTFCAMAITVLQITRKMTKYRRYLYNIGLVIIPLIAVVANIMQIRFILCFEKNIAMAKDLAEMQMLASTPWIVALLIASKGKGYSSFQNSSTPSH